MIVKPLLWVGLAVIYTPSVFAGEILLYTQSNCQSNPTVFAAAATTNCQQAEQLLTSAEYFGASTSRNIGPSCAFQIYTDRGCKTLGANITSSGPAKSCVPITKGLVSYKISCTSSVSSSIVRPRDEPDLSQNNYVQPQVTYRGRSSGNTTFAGYSGYRGNTNPKKPTGDVSSTGTKLAAALFSQVPSNTNQFTTSITDNGTKYTVTLTGYTQNGYTAETAAQTMGMAAFGSLMADTAAQLSRTSAYYLYYNLDNFKLDQEMGSINMTYVAP